MKWESKSSVMNTESKQASNSHQLQDEDCITSCSSLLRSFPSSSCILSTPSPPLPPMIVHSTDKSPPLHKPSLFNLSLCSCYKTSLQLLGKDLLLQIEGQSRAHLYSNIHWASFVPNKWGRHSVNRVRLLLWATMAARMMMSSRSTNCTIARR